MDEQSREGIINSPKLQGEEKLCRVIWQVFVAVVLNLHSNGCQVAMTGLIIARLKEHSSSVQMTPEEETWFASMFLIGSTAGTLLSGIKSGYLGRKKTVLITHSIAIVGALCVVLATKVQLFYAGNFLAGYSNGVNYGVIPIYTGEINQPKIRKFTGSFLALTFFAGFSLIYVVDSCITWKYGNNFEAWKVAGYVQTGWPCFVFLLLLLCPESPTWLMGTGRRDLAIQTLMKLRGNTEVAMEEIKRLETNLARQKEIDSTNGGASHAKYQLQKLTKGTFIRPVLVVTILMAVCWQWTGGLIFEFYTVDILKKFEITIDPYLASIAIGCYQLLGGLLGVLISSLLPRRKYYISSGLCIFIGAFLLGTVVHLRKYEFFSEAIESYIVLKWIPVIAILIFFAGYSTGYVSVCFMLLGELLPSNGRELGSFIIVQANNISSIILIKFTPNLLDAIGLDGLFWLFSGIAMISILFAYFFVPESFEKTLEEIEDHYRRVCYPNRSRNEQYHQNNTHLQYIPDT